MLRFTIILFFFLVVKCDAQTLISGEIRNDEGSVFAANVYLKSNPQQGTTTDLNGKFEIDLTNVRDTLIVYYIGFDELLIPAENLKVDDINVFFLSFNSLILQEVTIRGRDPISEQFSAIKLEKMDIYLNPVAQGDPLKAISILPASTITDETANPSLRGSDPDRSRVILNGVPIYNPIRASQINNQGFFSVFNPELIDKQYVYASNPPLIYGNSSAGLVDIQTTKRLESNKIMLSSTLVGVGCLVSHKLDSTNSFIQAFSNYQVSDAFIGIQKENLPNLRKFSTVDFGINLGIQLDENWVVNSYTYGINENFQGVQERFLYFGPFESFNSRVFTVNTVEHNFKNNYISLHLGYNAEEKSFAFGNTVSQQEIKQWYSSLNYKVKLNDFNLQFVTSIDNQTNQFDDITAEFYYALFPGSPTIESQNEIQNSAIETGLYASWQPNDKWLISHGIRANKPILDQSSFLSWQFGIRYNLNSENSVLLSGGRYYNYTTPSFFQQSFTLLSSNQIALDYTYKSLKTTITGALYYKDERGNQFIESFLTVDRQNTFGIELFIQKQITNYISWSGSYSYINQFTKLGDTYFPGSRNADYFVKSILKFDNPKWLTISLNWIARSGTPFTGIIGGEFDAKVNTFRPLFSDRLFQDQFNDYSRLDVNMSKYVRWNNKELVVFVSINNILNQRNQRIDQYNENYSVRHFDYFQLRLFFIGMVWTIN